MNSILWEYRFVLHTCNLSSETRTRVNPFTNEKFQLPVDEGLNATEVKAVEEVFAAYKVKGPFDGGHLVGPVYGNDWINFHTEFELQGPKPVVSISTFITTTELSDEMAEMVLALAQKGNLALVSQLGMFVRIIDRQPTSKELARWPDAKKLSSTTELRDGLQNDIKGEPVSEEDNAQDAPIYFSK